MTTRASFQYLLEVWRSFVWGTASTSTGTGKCTMPAMTPLLRLVPPLWTKSSAKSNTSSVTKLEHSPRISWSSTSALLMANAMVRVLVIKCFSVEWSWNKNLLRLSKNAFLDSLFGEVGWFFTLTKVYVSWCFVQYILFMYNKVWLKMLFCSAGDVYDYTGQRLEMNEVSLHMQI